MYILHIYIYIIIYIASWWFTCWEWWCSIPTLNISNYQSVCEYWIYLTHSGPVLYTLVQTPSKHCKLAITDAVVLPIPESCCVTEHKAAPGSSKQQVTNFCMSYLKSFLTIQFPPTTTSETSSPTTLSKYTSFVTLHNLACAIGLGPQVYNPTF